MTEPSTRAASAHAAVRTSFTAGSTRPIAHRRKVLEQLLALLVEHDKELCAAITSDVGRHEAAAYVGDIFPCMAQVRLALESVEQWAKPQKIGVPFYLQPGKAELVPEPKGVVLIISPYNYPVTLLLSPLAAALAAGNCCVIKPSEHAPATNHLLASLVPRYLDPSVVRLLDGGVDVSKALLALRWCVRAPPAHPPARRGGACSRVVSGCNRGAPNSSGCVARVCLTSSPTNPR